MLWTWQHADISANELCGVTLFGRALRGAPDSGRFSEARCVSRLRDADMRDPQRLAQSRSARHARPEYRLTLRQADQAREDFAAIVDELDFVKGQLSQMPTRARLSRMLSLRFASVWAMLAALAFWLAA